MQARDGLKITHIVKPTVCRRWASIGKRWGEDHTGRIIIDVIIPPVGGGTALVQVKGVTIAGIAQFVIVERQRRVLRGIASIGLIVIYYTNTVNRKAVAGGISSITLDMSPFQSVRAGAQNQWIAFPIIGTGASNKPWCAINQ